MNRIPFVTIDRENRSLEKIIISKTKSVIKKSQLILGDEVENFEKNFSTYCGVKYTCGVGNGYDALFLSIMALGITHDDEILVQTNSFIASALAISNSGAKPVFVDCVDDSTYTVCLKSAASKITNKTKAIMIVHLYGMPADMENIQAFAKKNNLFIIEDCAQAHGAMIYNKMVGSFGDLGIFSFYPTKNLGALGDGGCVVSNNYKLINKVKMLANYGSKEKYNYITKGFNSRLDTIQAGILNIKLKSLDKWNCKRIEIANLYIKKLEKYSEIILPKPKKNTKTVWHLFVIRYTKRDFKKFVKFLKDNGISTSIHYPTPIHKTKAYGSFEKLENAEKFSKQYISLPIHPFLKINEIVTVIKVIKKYLGNR